MNLPEYMVCHDSIGGFFDNISTKIFQGCEQIVGESLTRHWHKWSRAVSNSELWFNLWARKGNKDIRRYTESFGASSTNVRVVCFSGTFAGFVMDLLGFNTFTVEGNLQKDMSI